MVNEPPAIRERVTVRVKPGMTGTLVASPTPMSSSWLLKLSAWTSTKRGNGPPLAPESVTISPLPTRLAAGQAAAPCASSWASLALHCSGAA